MRAEFELRLRAVLWLLRRHALLRRECFLVSVLCHIIGMRMLTCNASDCFCSLFARVAFELLEEARTNLVMIVTLSSE